MAEDTEKTISLESARLFRVRTYLGFPRLHKGSLWHWYVNPVEVVSEDGRRLGWASLQPAGGAGSDLKASLVLAYDSPERLSIEVRSEKLYARMKYGSGGYWDGIHISAIVVTREPEFHGQPALGESIL